jgi:hypothetical protein
MEFHDKTKLFVKNIIIDKNHKEFDFKKKIIFLERDKFSFL